MAGVGLPQHTTASQIAKRYGNCGPAQSNPVTHIRLVFSSAWGSLRKASCWQCVASFYLYMGHASARHGGAQEALLNLWIGRASIAKPMIQETNNNLWAAAHMGVAQKQRARVTQVLVFGSIYQGAILAPFSEPQPHGRQ